MASPSAAEVLVHTPATNEKPLFFRFCHGSVDTPTTGVDTGFQTLRQNDEEKVKCVDIASSGVDTSPSSQRTQLTGLYYVSTQPQVVSTLDPVPRRPHPTQDKSQELSRRRVEERERGICIQRSRAAPPREEEGEEEGEEEKELEIAVLVIQKEVQPSLYLCLSRGAQGLVNLLNSQVVFRVGRCAYLLGFFELLNSKRLESSCSRLYCTCASGSSVVRRCNKSGHMKADCPEGKKEKHKTHKKEFHKKKNKAMVATWSDDESSDCNEESSSSEGNEICFMVGSSEEQVDISFELFTIDDWQEVYGVYRFCHGSVDIPTTGVDTGFQTLRQNDEEKVKCVDTASSGVDTSPSSQRTQLTSLYCASTQSQVVSTLDPVPRRPHPTQDKSQELSGRRVEKRERGICIQRSRAAPPREEEGEEEGEEEKELEIAAVLIQKEIQPSLYLAKNLDLLWSRGLSTLYSVLEPQCSGLEPLCFGA
ncbi:hypothetical protein Taro_014374 [Colocasia esculenta]|uniref:CCHC-type domain-containing protein n=1 Tax=Colocasia esculenta TaxID=4460 RepID=A0A843UIM8_COLES|nr:hypothetical protein [Colocasia esculenta]